MISTPHKLDDSFYSPKKFRSFLTLCGFSFLSITSHHHLGLPQRNGRLGIPGIAAPPHHRGLDKEIDAHGVKKLGVNWKIQHPKLSKKKKVWGFFPQVCITHTLELSTWSADLGGDTMWRSMDFFSQTYFTNVQVPPNSGQITSNYYNSWTWMMSSGRTFPY